MQLIIFL